MNEELKDVDRRALELATQMQSTMTEVEQLSDSLGEPLSPRADFILGWAYQRLVEDGVFVAPLKFARPNMVAFPDEPKTLLDQKLDELAATIFAFSELKPRLPQAFCAHTLLRLAMRIVYLRCGEPPDDDDKAPPHPDPLVRRDQDYAAMDRWFDEMSIDEVDGRDALHDILEELPHLDWHGLRALVQSMYAPPSVA